MLQKLPRKYDHCDPRRLYESVTSNETWIKFTDTTRKQQSQSWIPKFLPSERPVQTLENTRFCIVYFSMHMFQLLKFLFLKADE